MVVCKYFLQGNCRFGEKCYYEHTQNTGTSNFNRSLTFNNRRGRGGYSGGTYGAVGSGEGGYSGVGNGTRGGSNFTGGFSNSQSSFVSSNRYTLLDQTHNTHGDEHLTSTEMLDVIKKDFEEWIQGNMWPFSCYRPSKANSNFTGFEDTSFEELRYEAYQAVKNNTYEQYKRGFDDLANTVSRKRNELMHPSQPSKSNLIDICKTIFSPSISSSNGSTSAFETSNFGSNTRCSSTFGSLSTNTFGSIGEGFVTGSTTSGFGSKTTVFGSSSFGQSAGMFSSAQSTSFSAAKPNSFAAGSDSTFIKGQNQPATSAFLAPGLFGKSVPAATQAPITAADSNIYTPIDQITKEQKEQFEASHFTLGKIPILPPPKELVS
ncbi:nucleoporin NUP42-like [Antedon mediterranea]|uniref:nucleoporin NUP42-like n=1 Tax=Antedon mediterranea TaxID=105859 RepID=UPI003AF4A2CE